MSDFDLRRHRRFLAQFQQFLDPPQASKILATFLQSDMKLGFFRITRDDEPHLTSTITCLSTIELLGLQEEFAKKWTPEEPKAIYESILQTSWKTAGLGENNISAVSLLLPGLNRADDIKGVKNNEKIKKCLAGLKAVLLQVKGDDLDIFGKAERERYESDFDQIPLAGGLFIPGYPLNAFLTYWGLEGLNAYEEYDPSTTEDLEPTKTWAQYTLYQHLALEYTREFEDFDVFQLIYSFLILKKFFGLHFSRQFIRKIFQILFTYYKKMGTRDKGHKLFHYPGGGDAYCHEFEMLRTFLEVISEAHYELLEEYLPELENTFQWIRDNFIQKSPEGTTGWRSGHSTGPLPESWATAAVLDFLYHYRKLVQVHARKHAERALGYYEGTLSTAKGFEEILDCSLRYENKYVSLRNELRSLLDGDNRPRGIVLAGPPGTGKTSIARAIAKHLQWRYIEILPSHFTGKGFWQIGEKAREIFAFLELLDETVILFDELDELVTERSGESALLNRFLTTTMLPLLQHLHDRDRILYIIATNRIGKFDKAIVRPGRFDVVVNVNPPARSEIINEFQRRIREYLEQQSPDGPTDPATRVCKQFSRFLSTQEKEFQEKFDWAAAASKRDGHYWPYLEHRADFVKNYKELREEFLFQFDCFTFTEIKRFCRRELAGVIGYPEGDDRGDLQFLSGARVDACARYKEKLGFFNILKELFNQGESTDPDPEWRTEVYL